MVENSIAKMVVNDLRDEYKQLQEENERLKKKEKENLQDIEKLKQAIERAEDEVTGLRKVKIVLENERDFTSTPQIEQLQAELAKVKEALKNLLIYNQILSGFVPIKDYDRYVNPKIEKEAEQALRA